MDDSFLLISGFTFSLLSLALAIAAQTRRKAGIMFRAVCSVASGEVVDMIEVECDEKPNTWAPRIGFVDQNGRYVEFQTTSSCYPPEYRVRQKVRVFYLPGQSETPLVETEARNFHSWMTIAAAAVGTAVIGAGAFFHLGR